MTNSLNPKFIINPFCLLDLTHPPNLLMISFTRAQVPAFLVNSTFYESLSCEDTEVFSIPTSNFKQSAGVQNAEELVHLLHTLRYWGVHNFPYDSALISYLASVPLEERGKVGDSLRDFDWSAQLATWLAAFHALNDVRTTDPEYAGLITRTGALPSISPFLVSQNETLRLRTLPMLTVVASASDASAESVYSAASAQIIKLGDHVNDYTSTSYVQDVVKLLSRVCKHFSEFDTRTIMPLLTRLLSWPDDETVASACHVIGQIAEIGFYHLSIVFKARVLPRLVELVKSNEKALQPAASLRALGALCTGDDYQTQMILNLKVVPLLVPLITSADPEVVGNVVWMLSNIAGGSDEKHIQALIDAKVFPALFEVAQTTAFEHQKEFSWIMDSLLLRGVTTAQQLQYLVGAGVVPAICQVLVSHSESGPLLLKCISSLLGALHGQDDTPSAVFLTVRSQVIESGGVAGVQSFLDNEDESLHQLAANLMSVYLT